MNVCLDLCHRLDLLMQAERSVSDSLLWAVFLTPFLEQGPDFPEDFKDLRDFVHQGIKEALAGIEFPRQRHDDVSQILALEARVAPLLRGRRPVPARQARLALYPEAWLLYPDQRGPGGGTAGEMRPGTAPTPRPSAQGRQTAAPHPAPPPSRPGPGRGERKPWGRGLIWGGANGPYPYQKLPQTPSPNPIMEK